MRNTTFFLTLVSLLGMKAAAQMEIVEIEKPQLTHVLAGVVIDPSGAALQRVTVEDRSADWKNVLRSTETDERGRFHFSPHAAKSIYYLQFSRSGFNWLRLKLQIDKKSKKTIFVKMPIGT